MSTYQSEVINSYLAKSRFSQIYFNFEFTILLALGFFFYFLRFNIPFAFLDAEQTCF